MLLHAIDRVMKSLYRSVFPDPRLRPRRRVSGCSSCVAADVWCYPRAGEALEPRLLLSGVVGGSLNDAAAQSEKSRVALGVIAAGVPAVLVVDSTADVNDGNFSARHLSLREAVFLANANPDATTITFSKRIARLRLTQVGDNTADNSALAITTDITIVGPAGGKGVTLVGTGSSGDLRLFRVLAGGDLTLKRLTMTNWRTDTNGGVLAVDPGGIVSLTDCTLSNNSALSQGGAIYSLSFGSVDSAGVTLTNCTLSGNQAHDGGAFNGGGQTYGGLATFINCVLRGNIAVDRGGAIALYNTKAKLTNCTVVGNSAHQGGGIAGGEIVLDHSALTGNRAVDGGGIFSGIGGGASDGKIVIPGGPGYLSTLVLDSCTFLNNVAQHRGGGVFVDSGSSILTSCTFSGNRAQQGGGFYLDNSEARFFTKAPTQAIRGTVFSSNVATETGGGIFINNGEFAADGWTFVDNVAKEGAALFNNLADVTITNSTVVQNRSQQGTQLFNHLGILSLTHSTVSDIGQMKFISANNVPAMTFAAPNPGLEPAAIVPSAKDTIVTAADGIRYSLTADRLLLRQYPGCNWSILDDLVQSYKIAPDGEIYWLNDRGDLYRSQAGNAGDLIGLLVQSYAMDKNGTVYDLSNGVGPGNFAAYRSLTSPLLDPVEPPLDGGFHFAQDPPEPEEIINALGLAGPDIHILRMAVEPVVDRIDAPHYYPNIGLAQMHHEHYKCTVYYSTDLNGQSVGVVYLDRDHLHRYELGQNTPSAFPSQSNTSPAATAAIATVSDANRSDNIFSIWTGPDGTIYKLGGDYNGAHLVGTPPLPLVLWRLPPGGNWEPLLRVSAVEVAPDNTLFVLNTNHELQRLAPGASQWTTVASGVQSFTMTKDGTVYAIDGSGNLLREQQACHSNQWVLSTLNTGVQSFAVTAEGVLYELNNRHELKLFTGIGHWFVRIQTGVTSLEQAADGTIYTLNQRGQLKQLGERKARTNDNQPERASVRFPLEPWASAQRLISSTASERQGSWSVVARRIQSFQLDADGVLYALNRKHELTRMTAGGHWSLVDADVQSFVLAPNGLRNVYILTTHHELKRLEAGYAWRTLRTDAVSLFMDSEGVVTARDALHRSWMYWSPFTVPELDPVEGGPAPLFCQDPPTRDDVLGLLHIPDGPNVNVVIVDITEDALDPPRWFGNFGNNIPAERLHHCQYQCTVQYTTAQGLQTVVIDIDHDHLIRVAGPA